MPVNLYERDMLVWAEQQAGLLQLLAAGEPSNGTVDWANVIEEVQGVGLAELRSVRSLLRQVLVHLVRLQAWPDNLAGSDWRTRRQSC